MIDFTSLVFKMKYKCKFNETNLRACSEQGWDCAFCDYLEEVKGEKTGMSKYRKKPVVVEAMQWDGSNYSTHEIITFMGQKINNDFITQEKFYDYCNIAMRDGIKIETLEGTMTASVGDFIIKGVSGEFYPCKPDIFEKTYEKVEGDIE